MASRSLLKMKINPNLPLRFVRHPTLVLTRPVSPIAQPEAPRLCSLLGMAQNQFARQLGTSRSSSMPRGSCRMNDNDDGGGEEEEDDDVDFDEDMDVDFDDDGEYDLDDDEEEAEEEPRRKKSYGKK